MPKFSILFSRKRWEHLVQEVEADNLEAAEKMVAAYLGGGMNLEAIGSDEDWDHGGLDCEIPEVQIFSNEMSEPAFYPEDYFWPIATPAPLPPSLPRDVKKFFFRARTQIDPVGDWPNMIVTRAPNEEAALKAAKEFFCDPTAEFELLSEADLEEPSKKPPS